MVGLRNHYYYPSSYENIFKSMKFPSFHATRSFWSHSGMFDVYVDVSLQSQDFRVCICEFFARITDLKLVLFTAV
jgi:hypothetical protein